MTVQCISKTGRLLYFKISPLHR